MKSAVITDPADTELDIDLLRDSQLLTPDQAAEILSVGVGTLSVWRCVGRHNLPYVKMGSRIRYRAGDLKQFIARRTRCHTGEAA